MLSLSHSVARDTRPGPAAAQTTECLNPGQMSKLYSGDSFAKKIQLCLLHNSKYKKQS